MVFFFTGEDGDRCWRKISLLSEKERDNNLMPISPKERDSGAEDCDHLPSLLLIESPLLSLSAEEISSPDTCVRVRACVRKDKKSKVPFFSLIRTRRGAVRTAGPRYRQTRSFKAPKRKQFFVFVCPPLKKKEKEKGAERSRWQDGHGSNDKIVRPFVQGVLWEGYCITNLKFIIRPEKLARSLQN